MFPNWSAPKGSAIAYPPLSLGKLCSWTSDCQPWLHISITSVAVKTYQSSPGSLQQSLWVSLKNSHGPDPVDLSFQPLLVTSSWTTGTSYVSPVWTTHLPALSESTFPLPWLAQAHQLSFFLASTLFCPCIHKAFTQFIVTDCVYIYLPHKTGVFCFVFYILVSDASPMGGTRVWVTAKSHRD